MEEKEVLSQEEFDNKLNTGIGNLIDKGYEDEDIKLYIEDFNTRFEVGELKKKLDSTSPDPELASETPTGSSDIQDSVPEGTTIFDEKVEADQVREKFKKLPDAVLKFGQSRDRALGGISRIPMYMLEQAATAGLSQEMKDRLNELSFEDREEALIKLAKGTAGFDLLGKFAGDGRKEYEKFKERSELLESAFTKYDKSITEDLLSGENTGQGLFRLFNEAIGAIPSFLQAAVPYVGLASMGAGAAAEESAESQRQGRGLDWRTSANAAVYGVAEAALETVSRGIAKRFFKDLWDKPKKRGVKFLKEFMLKTSKSAGAEGLSETGTTFFQKLSDAYIKGDKEAFEGSLYEFTDTFLIGAVSGGAMSGAGSAANVVKGVAVERQVKRQLEGLDFGLETNAEELSAVKSTMEYGDFVEAKLGPEKYSNWKEVQQQLRVVPDDYSESEQVEAVNLLREKSKIEKKIEGKDKTLVEREQAQIEEINNKLRFIKAPEAGSKTELDAKREDKKLKLEKRKLEAEEAAKKMEEPEVLPPTQEDVIISDTPATVSEALNRPVTLTELGGTKLETPIEGEMYLEGQQVVVEDGEGNITEVGNIDEFSDKSLEEAGIAYKESEVKATTQGNLEYNGDVLVPDLKGIKANKRGDVSRVVLRTEDGSKTVTLRGSNAEDAAYNILLKEAQKDTELEAKLDEEFKQIEKTTQKPADKDTAEVNQSEIHKREGGSSISQKRTGQQNTEFFTGKAAEASSKVPYKPVINVDQNTPVAKSYKKFSAEGNFTGHISKMIAGFAEKQMKVAEAIVKGGFKRMLDIATSEGGMIKTVAANDKNIKAVGIDPNSQMKSNFESTPDVPNAEFRQEAFNASWVDDDGTVVNEFKPEEKFDVVNEDFAFQFMNNDRKTQVETVKSWMTPDGVFVTSEKFHTANQEVNEKKKYDHQRKYFSPDQLTEDKQTIVNGMSDDMVNDVEYYNILKDNFKYVEEFWNAGNFKGYIASDSKAKLDQFKENVGDLTTEFTDTESKTKPETKKDLASLRKLIDGDLDQEVENARKALSEIAPDVKIIISPTKIARAAGMWDPNTKTIYINRNKADRSTVAHEVFHAVLAIKIGSDKKVQELTDKMFNDIKPYLNKDLKQKIDAFTKRYPEGVRSEEALAEITGILAEGYNSSNNKAKTVIQNWLDAIAEFLGMNKIPQAETLQLLETIARKTARGEAITGTDLSSIKEDNIDIDTEQTSIKEQKIGDFEVSYFEDSNIFEEYKKRGSVEFDYELSKISDEVVAIHQPDNMLVGDVNYKGDKVFSGQGGVFYVPSTKNVWASGAKTSANGLARLINTSLKNSRDGKGRMVLVRGSDSKMISSSEGVKAAMSIVELLVDKKLISRSDFRSALVAVGKKYNVDFSGNNSSTQIHKDLQSKFMNVSNSTFARRGDFFDDVLNYLSKNSKSVKENIKDIRKALGSQKRIQFTKAGLRSAIGNILTERLLQGLPSGHIYAVVETNSPVKVVEDTKHGSYPFVLKTEDGSTPSLKIIKNRKNAIDGVFSMRDGSKVSRGKLGLSQRGMGIAKIARETRLQLVDDVPLKEEISEGIEVLVEPRRRRGSLYNGVVEKILTNTNYHPYGILVKLRDGIEGRVKSIIKSEKPKNKRIYIGSMGSTVGDILDIRSQGTGGMKRAMLTNGRVLDVWDYMLDEGAEQEELSEDYKASVEIFNNLKNIGNSKAPFADPTHFVSGRGRIISSRFFGGSDERAGLLEFSRNVPKVHRDIFEVAVDYGALVILSPNHIPRSKSNFYYDIYVGDQSDFYHANFSFDGDKWSSRTGETNKRDYYDISSKSVISGIKKWADRYETIPEDTKKEVDRKKEEKQSRVDQGAIRSLTPSQIQKLRQKAPAINPVISNLFEKKARASTIPVVFEKESRWFPLIDELFKAKRSLKNVKLEWMTQKEVNEGSDGLYSQQKDLVQINRNSRQSNHTLVHELTHAVTVKAIQEHFNVGEEGQLYINKLKEFIKKSKNSENKTKAAVAEIGELYLEAAEKSGQMSALEKFANKRLQSEVDYGFTNLKEFVAEAFSDVDFQNKLNNIETSKNSNIFTKFIDAINKLLKSFGVSEIVDNSILGEVIKQSSVIIDSQNQQSIKLQKEDKTRLKEIIEIAKKENYSKKVISDFLKEKGYDQNTIDIALANAFVESTAARSKGTESNPVVGLRAAVERIRVAYNKGKADKQRSLQKAKSDLVEYIFKKLRTQVNRNDFKSLITKVRDIKENNFDKVMNEVSDKIDKIIINKAERNYRNRVGKLIKNVRKRNKKGFYSTNKFPDIRDTMHALVSLEPAYIPNDLRNRYEKVLESMVNYKKQGTPPLFGEAIELNDLLDDAYSQKAFDEALRAEIELANAEEKANLVAEKEIEKRDVYQKTIKNLLNEGYNKSVFSEFENEQLFKLHEFLRKADLESLDTKRLKEIAELLLQSNRGRDGWIPPATIAKMVMRFEAERIAKGVENEVHFHKKRKELKKGAEEYRKSRKKTRKGIDAEVKRFNSIMTSYAASFSKLFKSGEFSHHGLLGSFVAAEATVAARKNKLNKEFERLLGKIKGEDYDNQVKLLLYSVERRYQERKKGSKNIFSAKDHMKSLFDEMENNQEDSKYLKKIVEKYSDSEGNIKLDKFNLSKAEKDFFEFLDVQLKAANERRKRISRHYTGETAEDLNAYIPIKVSKVNATESLTSSLDAKVINNKPSIGSSNKALSATKALPLALDFFNTVKTHLGNSIDYEVMMPVFSQLEQNDKEMRKSESPDVLEWRRVVFGEGTRNNIGLIKRHLELSDIGNISSTELDKLWSTTQQNLMKALLLDLTTRFWVDSGINQITTNGFYGPEIVKGIKNRKRYNTGKREYSNKEFMTEIFEHFIVEQNGRLLGAHTSDGRSVEQGLERKNSYLTPNRTLFQKFNDFYRYNWVNRTTDKALEVYYKGSDQPALVLWRAMFSRSFPTFDVGKFMEDPQYRLENERKIKKAINEADKITGIVYNVPTAAAEKVTTRRDKKSGAFMRNAHLLLGFKYNENHAIREAVHSILPNYISSKGHLSRSDAAKVLGIVTTRTIAYASLIQMIGGWIINFWAGEDEDEEENIGPVERSLWQYGSLLLLGNRNAYVAGAVEMAVDELLKMKTPDDEEYKPKFYSKKLDIREVGLVGIAVENIAAISSYAHENIIKAKVLGEEIDDEVKNELRYQRAISSILALAFGIKRRIPERIKKRMLENE